MLEQEIYSTPINSDTAEMMLARLGGSPADEPAAAQTTTRDGQKVGRDVQSFLNAHAVRVIKAEPYQGGMKYVLAECVFDESHKAPDAAVFVGADGKIGYKCFHNSCSGYSWRDARQRLDPGCYDRQSSDTAAASAKPAGDIVYQSLTLAELQHVDDPAYLIDGILEASQPGVIAGQYKSLKTTIALELAYSLTTGFPFLERFPVNDIARVGMFSGEAGPAQLRNSIRRIAKFHGDDSPWHNDRLILSCERLPKIGLQPYMDSLVRWIEQHNLNLAIIDPGYAALAAIGNSAGNYYMVADLLFQVTELQRQTGCVMLLAPHMTKAPKSDPPMLSDIQWSGFSEWAGQWLLLGKRREWNDQTGEHWLWLVAGGRSGHADTWGLDVREGRQDDPGGKVFEPSLVDKSEAFGVAADAITEQKQRQQTRQQEQEQENCEEAIRRAFGSLGGGWHIKAHIMDRTGKSDKGRGMKAAWAAMLRTAEIECQQGACKGGNNTPCDGYRITR